VALQSLREQGVHRFRSAGHAAGRGTWRLEPRERELRVGKGQAVDPALAIQMDPSLDGPIAETHPIAAHAAMA